MSENHVLNTNIAMIPTVSMVIKQTMAATILIGLLSLLLFYFKVCSILPLQYCYIINRYVRLLIIHLWLAALAVALIPAFISALSSCLWHGYGYIRGIVSASIATIVAILQLILIHGTIQCPILLCVFIGTYLAAILCIQNWKVRLVFWGMILAGLGSILLWAVLRQLI